MAGENREIPANSTSAAGRAAQRRFDRSGCLGLSGNADRKENLLRPGLDSWMSFKNDSKDAADRAAMDPFSMKESVLAY
jgi:hypothetical protein